MIGIEQLCAWCGHILIGHGHGTKYCKVQCRQSAFRLRRSSTSDGNSSLAHRGIGASAPGLAFAYADPPYVGLSAKYYRNERTFDGEVDHVELIQRLETQRLAGVTAGWALSCSSISLRFLLPLCPFGVRVCAWVKPIGVPAATAGPHSTWEAVLLVGGRKLKPGVRDWLRAQPARGGGKLPGRKPMNFCAWLFDLLGMVPGDRLLDLYPGTGGVGRAWANLSLEYSRRPSAGAERRLFLIGGGK